MKVYECKGFPNPARVRIALAEKGLIDAVSFVQVDVPNGEHRSPEFLAKNPSAVVPVLELEDGTMVSECSAITEYLDHAEGDPTLTGRTAKERAVIAMAQRKVEAGFLDAVAAYFHHATPGLGPDIETYQNADWGTTRLELAKQTMAWMDEVLATQPYLAGDRFTVADITAMSGVIFSGFVGLEIPENHTNLKAWKDRVFDRPSAALAA